MEGFDIKIALEWFGAIVISIGGTGVVVFALAKWFGERLANKLLEKDKAKYQHELEGVKNKYQEELEAKKTELEKSKTLFVRYSEHQFKLYNELWKSLCDLKHVGEELWGHANSSTVKKFSKQLQMTKSIVEKSALLIEDLHYSELIRILDAFGDFEVGKLRLITLRNKNVHELEKDGINEHEVRRVIEGNRQIKDDFNEMVFGLSTSFKSQIRGE